MSEFVDRLAALRDWMAQEKLDGFIIWRGDMFSGEEVRACDERLAFISGFTGSAGYGLVLCETAYLYSDGRYHLQMQNQLDSTLWQWRDASQNALTDSLNEAQKAIGKPALRLGFDGYTTSLAQFEKLPKQLDSGMVEWHGFDAHPIDEIWQTRPHEARAPAFALADEVAGQSAADKIAQTQAKLQEAGHDGLFISAVDCVNWLLNIRGSDLKNTPFHLAFAYLPSKGAPYLIGALLDEGWESDYKLISFEEMGQWLAGLKGCSISIDPSTLPFALQSQMKKAGLELVEEPSILMLPKAQKNQIELAGFDKAHLADALAFCHFWFALETQLDSTKMRETDLVAKLQSYRQAQAGYLCDSFDTIMGSGPNGAIIHYRALTGEDSAILENNLLLIDSGAHYQTGTTDITRTLLIGKADSDMIKAYSAVLAAHAALASALFPAGTTGQAIDAICRAPLWARGFDFAHGTGHGVGHILSVHEGPASISKRGTIPLEDGMVLSNEPGYYREGHWGIRLENLVAVQPSDTDFYGFRDLTLVPFERDLIDISILGHSAHQWVDAYHQKVAGALMPYLEGDIANWLADKTKPLHG